MKRLNSQLIRAFGMIMVIAMSACFVSCSNSDSTDNKADIFTYNVNIDGDASGDVIVTFPNGSLSLDGDAGILFTYSNDTTAVFTNVLSESEIAASNDDVKMTAWSNVNDYMNNNFKVSAVDAGGVYDIKITGYVKEPITGLIIAIDRRFTNKKDSPVAVVVVADSILE